MTAPGWPCSHGGGPYGPPCLAGLGAEAAADVREDVVDLLADDRHDDDDDDLDQDQDKCVLGHALPLLVVMSLRQLTDPGKHRAGESGEGVEMHDERIGHRSACEHG